MEGLLKLIFIVGLTIETCVCFNIDTKFPIVFNGDRNSFFGFSVELLRNDQGEWALISAPKGNISSSKIHEPGVLYKCHITKETCEEVILDVLHNEAKLNLRNFSYKEVRDDMMLGISLAIQSGDENIVTCGHLWKNAFFEKLYFSNGACYYLNNDLNQKHVKKLLPLVEKSKQIPQDKIFNLYAYGIAGFSVTFLSNGKDFVIGAPGVYEGKGSLIYYNVRNSAPTSFPIIPQPELLEDLENDSYVGYSVTSGRFFHTSEISIATGAPRAENGYGCVYIFQSINRNNPNFVIQRKIIGHKLIEYFGAVVLGVNVNNDQYTDLLVSAPFYSTLHGGDEGKVYVYISDGKDLHEQKEALKGSNKPNSKFGTSVSNCGDLNKDGFIDIAIGAPFEDDKGAVYIYHGSKNGVKPEFIQRIAAEDFNIHLSGFGFAISKGKDIDFNAYPDILIGSYDSDNAVLLRSHPIISVDSKLEFSIKHVSINSSDNKCKINYEEISCFNLEYCAKYVGHEIPKELVMKTILKADSTKIYVPRAYFIENKNQTQKLESQITLQENREFCETQTVYLMNDIQDFISPMKFQLTYNLEESQSSQFCKNCPVIDATKPNFIAKEIMFWIGCGDDNECQSDLKISVKCLSKIDPFVIGEDLLEMEIKAENLGEPAYNSTVFIQIPGNIIMINQAECTSSEENSENYTLLCNVGNPLIYNNPKIFHLKMDTSNLSAPIEELVFKFWIETASEEIFPSNNFYNIIVPVIFKPDIQIRGMANNDIIYIQENTKELIPIIHTYFISKRLKNPIALVDITLSIPIKSSHNGPLFLELSSIQIDNGNSNVPASCNIGRNFTNPIKNPHVQQYRSIKRYTHEEHADHSNFDTINLDCSNTVCKFIKCKAGPFMDTKKFAKLQINAHVNLTNLQNNIGKKDVTVIVSEGTVLIQDENHDGKSAKGDYATVGTSLEKYGLHQHKKIGIWVIIVCIIAGILLLTLLILVLIKVGFFRRKEQEEMEKLKNDDDEETAALNDNPR